MCLQRKFKFKYLWQFMFTASLYWCVGGVTDVDTLQSQLFPTPLVSKSLYGVMDFENELIYASAPLNAVD